LPPLAKLDLLQMPIAQLKYQRSPPLRWQRDLAATLAQIWQLLRARLSLPQLPFSA
jgi:hypothetical protein